MMKHSLILCLMVGSLMAQTRTTVAISQGTPDTAVTKLFYYDASNNLEYICRTPSPQLQSYTWAVTPVQGQGTLTNIVVATNTATAATNAAHGLAVNNMIVVAGSTTALLNGAYKILTSASPTTFTFTTVGVGDATYATSALTLSTTAPRTTTPIWSIEKYIYNAANLPTTGQWATTTTAGSSGTTAYSFICANRSATGSTQISFQ